MATKFGELVVDLGYVTQEQLDEAIYMQKKGRAKLGQVMKILRLLIDLQVVQVLECQKNAGAVGKLFGDCAVELGLVTEKQRDEAVRYQTGSKGVLGDMLVQLGFLTTDQRNEVIRQQMLN